MIRMILWVLRAVLLFAAAIAPVIFADQIKSVADTWSLHYKNSGGIDSLNWPFLLFLGILVSLAIVEWCYDVLNEKETKEANNRLVQDVKDETRRLEYQRTRTSTFVKLIEILRPGFLLIERQPGLSGPDRENAAKSLNEVIPVALQIVTEEVLGFLGGEPKHNINCNLMVAYSIDEFSCINKKFEPFGVGFGRKLDSYKYVLCLEFWARPEKGVPALALPVEDPQSQ